MKELEYGCKVLFEFQTIVDLDLALLRYIQLEFSKSKFFNKQVLSADTYTLKALLVTRTNKNPLSVIIEDEYMDKIETLYNELIDTKEEDILKLALPLATLTLIGVLNKGESGIECVVNCKNVVEEQFIKYIDKDIVTITDRYNVDLSKYSGYYIKNVEDSIKYKTFSGKSIYFLDYEYNIEPNRKDRMPLFKVAALLYSNNLYLVDPYSNFKLPV